MLYSASECVRSRRERAGFKTGSLGTDGMSMSWRLRVGAVIFVFAAVLVALVLADFEPTSYGVTRLAGGISLSFLGASLLRSSHQLVKRSRSIAPTVSIALPRAVRMQLYC